MTAGWPLGPLRRVAEASPEATALVWPGGAWSYAELSRRADDLAAALRARGFATGDYLALHAANSPEAVALFWACWRAGIVLALIGHRWPTAAAEARAQTLTAPLYDEDALLDLVGEGGGGRREEGRQGGAVAPCIPPPTHNRTATVVWTSGSSGAPKAALHSARNHLASAAGVVPLLQMESRSRYLLSLPLASVGGLAVLVRCALVGAAAVLPERGVALRQQMERGAITHASLVSTQLIRLLGEEGRGGALGRLRAVLLGGSAMPSAMLAESRAHGLPIAPGYALTEMASTVSAVAPGGEAGASSGRVLPHRAVRISAEGEIEVNGATRFLGYLEAGEAGPRLAEPFGAGGWFATGDLSALDADGRLRVAGRRGNRFVSGGANVQPEAIEAALLRVPEVRRAAVVPVPSEEFGQRPVAFVGLALGIELGKRVEAALAEAVRAELPSFMVPDVFLPMPKSATLPGSRKLDRKALSEIAVM